MHARLEQTVQACTARKVFGCAWRVAMDATFLPMLATHLRAQQSSKRCLATPMGKYCTGKNAHKGAVRPALESHKDIKEAAAQAGCSAPHGSSCSTEPRLQSDQCCLMGNSFQTSAASLTSASSYRGRQPRIRELRLRNDRHTKTAAAKGRFP